MKKKNLLNRLSNLGFSLFETEEAQDANATLAEVVKSRDLRLWEGFPVVLANSAEKGLFKYDTVKFYLKGVFDKGVLNSLMLMSLSLYKSLNLKFSWADKLSRSLPAKEKKELNKLLKKLKKNEEFQVAGRAMSSRRLKSTFNNYFNQAQTKLNDLLSMKEEANLEYSLSRVFSPKQKELFLKKLKGEKLTKTEREYFSRAVKKKLLALANPELHRLSQRLLES
ncbi:MAG: hypothetical protein KKH29_02990 [Candidatus Omnitrophica bacterium]|nr:hypothetical protein [Candidatus Omnitrophota bacterium]MBU4473528.1 hypothetical protein [Candidatus Omnitrophota bacterium]MCG2706167.1 hypothetical protein [Candidatus Omnitrophota bacterium]